MKRKLGTLGVAGIAGALAGVASPSIAQDAQKYLYDNIDKATPVEVRRANVETRWNATRVDPHFIPEVIYGDDDRIEVYEETDPQLKAMADACVVVVDASELIDNGDGTYTLLTSDWTSQGGLPLCPDEPFVGQPQIGFCSGFMVGSDLIATAGHCVSPSDVGSVGFVFGFRMQGPGLPPMITVSADDVYFAAQSVNYAQSGDLDHSLVRVDRPIVGHNPVPIRRSGELTGGEPMAVIGHPVVLPQKIGGGAIVKDPHTGVGYYESNLDTYGGNSGSMVVNLDTYEVEGILVRGITDFVFGSCVSSNRISDNNGSYEECSKVGAFVDDVPPLGLTVQPLSNTTHIGVVGGPFTNTSVAYTLSNSTSDPVDYTVDFDVPGGQGYGLTIDGGSSQISGTLPASGQTTVTVALGGGANALAAGVYTETIVFTDVTNARAVTTDHIVEVGQTLVNVTPGDDVFASGPVGGPFTGGSQTYTITSERPTGVTVDIAASESWIDVAQSSVALNGTGDFADVSVSLDQGVLSSFPAGIITGQVTFTNMTSGAVTSRDVTVDVGRFVYNSSDTPQPINDNSTIFSSIDVSESFCVGDVDVELDINHTFQGDLIVELTSPRGTTVRLHDRTGGDADDLILTYDQDGGVLPDGPGSLDDFDTEPSTGLWTLTVSDNAGFDTGTLNSWSLRVASGGDVCPPSAGDLAVQIAPNSSEEIALVALPGGSGNAPDFVITSLPTSGKLWDPAGGSILSVPTTLSGDSVIYRAAVGFQGADSFTYIATDGLDSDPATVSIDVTQQLYLVFEDFEGGSLPAGWAVEDYEPGGSATTWRDNVTNLLGNYTGGAGLCYTTNSDDFVGEYDVALVTPPFTPDATSELTLLTNYQNLANEDFADIDISTDGGSSWTNLLSWNEDHGAFFATPGESVALSLAAYDGIESKLRFHHYNPNTSDFDWHWEIDDVGVSAAADACAPDLTGEGDVNTNDFFAFLALYQAGDPLADLTNDGLINTNDFFAFLALYQSGC